MNYDFMASRSLFLFIVFVSRLLGNRILTDWHEICYTCFGVWAVMFDLPLFKAIIKHFVYHIEVEVYYPALFFERSFL